MSTAQAAISSAQAKAPLSSLLEAASGEMFELSRVGGRLHDLIERQMALTQFQDGSIEDAQLIDFLVQHLEAVGIFLRLLAAEAPPGVSVDFIRLRGRLPLADLTRRLLGEEPTAPIGSASGELDLF